MKILLSAYACEPNKGSEPGVGWNWALALARRGDEVHVLTRSNNREVIENARGERESNLHFHFYDLPYWARFWKRWPMGIYFYYLLWQIGAYRLAKRLHLLERFDIVHHITFVSHRQPSFMGGLKIPFVFGPVGGGEIMPAQLRESLPWRAKFVETFRDLGNRFVAIDPLMRSTYSAATLIACATDETLLAIPERFHSKCTVQRAIGIDLQEIGVPFDQLDGKLRSATQLLFVGRLLYWKGLQFALRAMEIVRDSVPGAKLRIVGEGNDADWLKHIAQNAQLSDCVEWISRIAFDQMWKEYLKSAALVFPSLHDSGGMVVLEAMAAGMPVICLDLGGPGSMVDSSCGVALASSNRSELDIVKELSNVMIRMISEQEWQRSLAGGARERARTMSWDAAASAIYSNRSVLNRLGNQ